MKEFVPKLSRELFLSKIDIEKELAAGNKSNENLYRLILKAENFLRDGRKGAIISKKLPIYKHFEEKYGINNLFLFDLSSEARAFYTHVSHDEFKILQIILEVYENHKEYEKKGKYNKH